MRRLLIPAVCVFAGAVAFAQQPPPAAVPAVREAAAEAPRWPTASWETAPLPPDADARAVEALLAEAFESPPGPLGETRALVVIQGGRLVLERYAEGYGPETKLVSWSVAKSITQALVGAAALAGKLDPDAPMGSPHFRRNHPLNALSWRDWLQMVDGQSYTEIGAKSIVTNDAARKLFGPGAQDVARFCAGLPVIRPPRQVWNYNSCGIVLTADALTRAVAPAAETPAQRRAAMHRWMQEALFGPLGMRSATAEFDPQGLFYGSALIYASARDFAKFGQLYLRDGVWDGRRLLPEGWVAFARTPGPGANTDTYGAGWWLAPKQGRGKLLPYVLEDGPRDAFSAQGFEGQFILVVPSKDLVVVRLGLTRDTANPTLRRWMGGLVGAFADRSAEQS